MPDKTKLEGRIAKVLSQPTTTAISLPHLASLGGPFAAHRSQVVVPTAGIPLPVPQLSGISGSQFILTTDDGDVLISVGSVQRLTIKEMNTTLPRTVTTKQRTKRLTFQFAEAGKRREMLLVYFRPGVRWIPTYRVNLTKGDGQEKVADLSMQAEILNEAEDLIDVPIDIVVGVPNFRFRETVSPLALEQTMRNTLLQAAPNLMGQMRNDFSNGSYSQRSGEFRRNAAQASAVAGGGSAQLPDELTATGAQDLFVYNLPKMTLKKGERAAVPVVSAQVPYRDVYTWDLHLKRSDIATAPSGSQAQSPLVLSKNRVWRQIELLNNTKLPWTTGAAMIMQGNQPLAQELLTYTSPKDYCRVPVTVSVDTRGSFTESEIGRKFNVMKWSGYQYAKINQRATLDVCNNKPETIDLEVTLRFGGKADKISDDGKVTLAPYRAEDWQNYRGHPAVNNSSVIVWKKTLKAGETFLPTVDYHFFSRQ